MKKFLQEFLKRALPASVGGPLVLAIIYGILGSTGKVESLNPTEVCLGIFTAALLAFIVGGSSAIYTIERLPVISATLLHCVVLYCTYLTIYLLNGWLSSQSKVVFIFTAIFFAGYGIIWFIIYLCIRHSTKKLNQTLQNK